MSHLPVELILAIGTIAIAVIGYFLKKTYEKIDATVTAVSQLSKDFSDKIDKLQEQMDRDNRTNRVELTNLFQEICRERQGACGKLQLANFAAIELRVSTACQKIEKINEDRERRWERQDQINDQIKRVLYQSSDGGHSWQLKQNTGGKENG